MSYIYRYLPDKEVLEKRIVKNPHEIKYYAKYDSFIGSTESITYLTKLLNEYHTPTEINRKAI